MSNKKYSKKSGPQSQGSQAHNYFASLQGIL